MKDKILKLTANETEHDLYLLSLFYRLEDDYENEFWLINKALTKHPTSDYFRSRKKWHDLPQFDQMEARPKRQSHKKPDPEILEQMCFVTAADSGYFTLLVEMIESLKATDNYANIPIKIFDLGFSDEHKHFLSTNFGINDIVSPGWDVFVPEHTNHTERGRTARPFIPKYFPGYRYYFWLDSDLWIQEEDYLSDLLSDAGKFGVGIAIDQVRSMEKAVRTMPYYRRTFTENLHKKAINSGIVCIDSSKDIFEKWQYYFVKKLKKGYHWLAEQTSLNAVYLDMPGDHARDHRYNFQVPYQWPIFHHNDPYTIYTSDTNEVGGIIHLNHHAVRKFGYELYVTQSDIALCETELAHYWQVKDIVLRQKKRSHVSLNLRKKKKVSFRYRMLPWKEKEAIKEELLRSLSC